MKNRKFLCGILALAATCCLAGGVACGGEKSGAQGWDANLTFSAELNETFYKPVLFDGYAYSIKDETGAEIPLTGDSFVNAGIGDYKIHVVKNGKTHVFPLYVRDTQKPLFVKLSASTISRTEGETVNLHEIFRVNDNSGGVDVSYQVERNGLETIAIDEDGKLLLQYGFYNVMAIAKDPSGNTAEQNLKIQVKESLPVPTEELLASTACYLETLRFSSDYHEIAPGNAFTVLDDENGFVWQLNTGIDAWCNQLVMIDLDEIFGGVSEIVDTVTFKLKLGDAFQSDASKNWIEFYNYYRESAESVELMEGDWVPSEYGNLTYEPIPAVLSGMQTETEYAITLSRTLRETSTNYLIIRVRCSRGEDGTYNFAPTLLEDSELARDYTISLYDFKVCANMFTSERVEMGAIQENRAAKTFSWAAVENAVSYQVRIGSFGICLQNSPWQDVGNVTSFDYSGLDVGSHRVAVRAVFADGYSAASIGKVTVPSLTGTIFLGATGRLEETLYQGDYVARENMVSLTTFEGREAIQLQVNPDSEISKRRALVIDLQAIFGAELSKISSITFQYNLGTAFKNGGSGVNLGAWLDDAIFADRDFYTPNLFLINGQNQDMNYCYHNNNSVWYSITVKPHAGGNSRYILFMLDPSNWADAYEAEKATGLTSDYSVYFSDFSVTYAE